MEGEESNQTTALTPDTTERKTSAVVSPQGDSHSDDASIPDLDPNNLLISRILKMKDDKTITDKEGAKVDDKRHDDPVPDTRIKTDLVNEELGTLLSDLFEEIDLYDEKPHEILQGLSMHGIKSWNSFIRMTEDDVERMVRPSRNKPVPLSSHSINMIRYLKQLIWERIADKHPSAKDISSYSRTLFDEYIDNINLRKRKKVEYSVSTSGLPAFSPNTSKSSGEKKYETWTRAIGKRTKTSFEILKTDDQYRLWKPIFDAELAHQQMAHTVDPAFDPTTLTCSFEKLLWKEQQAYLWTILLYVFKNPLGRICTSNHMKDKDARTSFFEHERMQDQSPAKAYSTSIYLSTLRDLSIKTHQGTRVDFIATWFDLLWQLNEISDDAMNYDMVKGLLLTALHGDTKLSDIFTELNETYDKDVDIENLKVTLLQRAALYDNRDVYLKVGKASAPITAASTEVTDSSDLSLLIHRSTRAPNPEARLPDSIFDSLEPTDKSAWRQLPETTRIKLVRLLQSKGTPPPPDRWSIYFQDTTSPASSVPDSSPLSDSATARSELTDDSHLLQGLRSLVINASTATKTPATPPTTCPPVVKSPKTPSTALSNSKPLKPNLKSPPKLSSMDPGHRVV